MKNLLFQKNYLLQKASALEACIPGIYRFQKNGRAGHDS